MFKITKPVVKSTSPSRSARRPSCARASCPIANDDAHAAGNREEIKFRIVRYDPESTMDEPKLIPVESDAEDDVSEEVGTRAPKSAR